MWRGERTLSKASSEEIERKKSAAQDSETNRTAAEEKIAAAEKSLSEAAQRIKELGESHAQLSLTCEQASARYTEMKQRLGDLHQEKSKLSEDLQRVSDELEKVRSKWEGLEREKAVLQERKEMVLERLRTEYAIEELDEKRKSAPPGTEAERQKLADEVSAMGEVNFRAEKEYKELKERSEFLETQKTDLAQAMDSLRKTITKIDAVSKDLFIETFDQINEAFKRYTQMLFKGGKGTLSLNPDTSGVELYVQPPGKRVTRMELFSGGEKALISLAFLLSLMDTKPSPFTLMDEIDAPLDDANLASLMEIVKDDQQEDTDRHYHPQSTHHGVRQHDVRNYHGRRRYFQNRIGKIVDCIPTLRAVNLRLKPKISLDIPAEHSIMCIRWGVGSIVCLAAYVYRRNRNRHRITYSVRFSQYSIRPKFTEKEVIEESHERTHLCARSRIKERG